MGIYDILIIYCQNLNGRRKTMKLTAIQEDYILEEGREKDACEKNNLCIFCFKKLNDWDSENSCMECE